VKVNSNPIPPNQIIMYFSTFSFPQVKESSQSPVGIKSQQHHHRRQQQSPPVASPHMLSPPRNSPPVAPTSAIGANGTSTSSSLAITSSGASSSTAAAAAAAAAAFNPFGTHPLWFFPPFLPNPYMGMNFPQGSGYPPTSAAALSASMSSSSNNVGISNGSPGNNNMAAAAAAAAYLGGSSQDFLRPDASPFWGLNPAGLPNPSSLSHLRPPFAPPEPGKISNRNGRSSAASPSDGPMFLNGGSAKRPKISPNTASHHHSTTMNSAHRHHSSSSAGSGGGKKKCSNSFSISSLTSPSPSSGRSSSGSSTGGGNNSGHQNNSTSTGGAIHLAGTSGVNNCSASSSSNMSSRRNSEDMCVDLRVSGRSQEEKTKDVTAAGKPLSAFCDPLEVNPHQYTGRSRGKMESPGFPSAPYSAHHPSPRYVLGNLDRIYRSIRPQRTAAAATAYSGSPINTDQEERCSPSANNLRGTNINHHVLRLSNMKTQSGGVTRSPLSDSENENRTTAHNNLSGSVKATTNVSKNNDNNDGGVGLLSNEQNDCIDLKIEPNREKQKSPENGNKLKHVPSVVSSDIECEEDSEDEDLGNNNELEGESKVISANSGVNKSIFGTGKVNTSEYLFDLVKQRKAAASKSTDESVSDNSVSSGGGSGLDKKIGDNEKISEDSLSAGGVNEEDEDFVNVLSDEGDNEETNSPIPKSSSTSKAATASS